MHRILIGLFKEVRPLPVLATFAAIALAFAITGTIPSNAGLLFACIFFLLYTVHCLDTFEDLFIRNEDAHKTFLFAHGSQGELTARQLLVVAFVSTLLFFATLFFLSRGESFLLSFFLLVAYVIGISYSSFLSKHLFLSLIAHPLGVVLAMLSAVILAGGAVPLSFCMVLFSVFLLMLGAKAWMDIADKETDAHTKRKNIAAFLGEMRTKQLAMGCLLLALFISILFSSSFVYAVGIIVIGIIFTQGYSLPPQEGVYLIMPGIFIFLIWSILSYVFHMA